MHWTDDWIGLPHAERGRGPGYDCLGLFVTITRVRSGAVVDDPLCTIATSRAAARKMRAHWSPVRDAPREGDAALFRIRGHALHVGYVLDRHRMLHIEDDTGSRIERLDGLLWKPRLEGFYRHDG